MGTPEFLDSGRKSWTLDSGRWTLDTGLWMLDSDAGRWTLDAAPWDATDQIRTQFLTLLILERV